MEKLEEVEGAAGFVELEMFVGEGGGDAAARGSVEVVQLAVEFFEGADGAGDVVDEFDVERRATGGLAGWFGGEVGAEDGFGEDPRGAARRRGRPRLASSWSVASSRAGCAPMLGFPLRQASVIREARRQLPGNATRCDWVYVHLMTP